MKIRSTKNRNIYTKKTKKKKNSNGRFLILTKLKGQKIRLAIIPTGQKIQNGTFNHANICKTELAFIKSAGLIYTHPRDFFVIVGNLDQTRAVPNHSAPAFSRKPRSL